MTVSTTMQVSASVAHAVRMFEQGRLGEGKYQPIEGLDTILADRLAALKPVEVPAPVKVAGAYRMKPLADPKTISLLYVGLYKPVWSVVGPMETVRVQLAADVALRGPTQKAVAGLAGSPTTALSVIQVAQALGHKNVLGVVNHMINTGQLTVLN